MSIVRYTQGVVVLNRIELTTAATTYIPETALIWTPAATSLARLRISAQYFELQLTLIQI